METATYSNQIVSDMKAVNDQFNVVMMRLCDILELALSKDKKDIIEDVSEEELSSTTDGKVYNCDNYGKVDGDVNVGGVAGTMDIEYDFDPESDSNVIKDSTLTAKYFTKCVLLDSKNYGDATSRKDCAGAICGYADLGVISGCEGYGTAEHGGRLRRRRRRPVEGLRAQQLCQERADRPQLHRRHRRLRHERQRLQHAREPQRLRQLCRHHRRRD